MKLPKFLMTMLFLTSISLVYIQLQVQILDLAYQGKDKERELQKQLDINGEARQKISTLKSANHIGIKLLSDNSRMQFLDDGHRASLRVPLQSLDNTVLASSGEVVRKPGILASIFSLKSKAEAGSIR